MTNLRRIKMKQLVEKVGWSKATIHKKVKSGEFPLQHKDGGSAFWFEHEIDAWLAKRHNLQPKASDEAAKDDAENA